MQKLKTKVGITILFLCFYWAGAANASIWLPGTAVGSPGSKLMVGSIGGPSPDGLDPFNGQTGLSSAIEYFIPLHDDNYGGTYGVTPGFKCASGSTSLSGTCSDRGNGDYDRHKDASGLKMNIWYDTDNAQFSSASLGFAFDDLDLIGDNDPHGFFESVSLSYWSWDGLDFNLNSVGGTVTTASGNPMVIVPNLIMWSLNLTDVDDLNDSSREKGGFWVQLGFGAKYKTDGRNTPEYLATALHVSPVPVPAAFWLFGTALVGFVGMSRRRKVT